MTSTPAARIFATGMFLIGRPAPMNRASAFSSMQVSSSCWKSLAATMMLTPIIPEVFALALRSSVRMARMLAARPSAEVVGLDHADAVGGDDADAALLGHRRRQAGEGDAHAHAALDDGQGNGAVADGQFRHFKKDHASSRRSFARDEGSRTDRTFLYRTHNPDFICFKGS